MAVAHRLPVARSAFTLPQLAERLHALATLGGAPPWARVLAKLAADRDPTSNAGDATYVRVHADGLRARGGYAAQAVGRARDERNNVTHAPALLTPDNGAHLVCDRGDDADWWRERLRVAG